MGAMTARRSFLARFGAAAAAFGLGSAAHAEAAPAAQHSPGARWQPARDQKDDWYDRIPGKHRLFFDAVSSEGVAGAIHFADNFFAANKAEYGLETAELAVVICLRHGATPFAFTDAIWAKYGAAISESRKLTDPKTGQTPVVNLYRAGLESHVKRGVHYAVCDTSSHHLAEALARKVGGDAEAIYKEMAANAVANAHFVSAGIVAVNRAQERGYAIAYAG